MTSDSPHRGNNFPTDVSRVFIAARWLYFIHIPDKFCLPFGRCTTPLLYSMFVSS